MIIYIYIIYINVYILSDILNKCQMPVENGNNEVKSTTGSEVETNTLPEVPVLAQVAQRCSAK